MDIDDSLFVVSKEDNCVHSVSQVGDPICLYKLALRYDNGDNVPQDFAKAFQCYHSSAKMGYEPAMHNLSFMYLEGRGVQKDPQEWLRWILLASDRGFAEAQYFLGLAYWYGDVVQPNMKIAFEWFEKASSRGHRKATTRLGQFYYCGKGTDQNYAKASSLFSATKEDPISLHFLAWMASSGEGREKNIKEALLLLAEAAKLNFPSAITEFGRLHMIHAGDNQSDNARKAFSFFRTAADLGDVGGLLMLGKSFAGGIGCTKNKNAARDCYLKALSFDHLFSGNDRDILSPYENKKSLDDIKNVIRQELAKLDKGCYISTAVALSKGWREDGPELNTLRMFRDNWMQKTQDRRDEVSEYYRMAPEIVESIDASPEPFVIYRQICDEYLIPALVALQSKKPENAHKIYRAMVMSLSAQYGNNQNNRRTNCS